MNMESRDDTLVLSDIKELGAANADDFRDQVRAALKETHKNIELDLAQTTFVDSCGLGAIIALHKNACSRQGRLRLLNPQPAVQQILDLTRMNRILEIITR